MPCVSYSCDACARGLGIFGPVCAVKLGVHVYQVRLSSWQARTRTKPGLCCRRRRLPLAFSSQKGPRAPPERVRPACSLPRILPPSPTPAHPLAGQARPTTRPGSPPPTLHLRNEAEVGCCAALVVCHRPDRVRLSQANTPPPAAINPPSCQRGGVTAPAHHANTEGPVRNGPCQCPGLSPIFVELRWKIERHKMPVAGRGMIRPRGKEERTKAVSGMGTGMERGQDSETSRSRVSHTCVPRKTPSKA